LSEVTAGQHKKNVLLLSAVEMFWGVGLGFVHIQTVAPAFLDDLKATASFIGLVAAASAGSMLMAQFLSGFVAEKFKKKKVTIIILHFLAPITWLFVFVTNYYFVNFASTYHIGKMSLLISMVVYSLIMGAIVPLYFAFISGLVQENRRAGAFGTIFAAQCLAGAVAVYFVGGLTKEWEFPQNYAMLYLFAFLLATVGNLFLFGTQEKVDEKAPIKRGLGDYLKSQVSIPLKDKPFRKYIYARLLLCANLVILTFMVKYAKERFFVGGTEWARLFAFYFLLGQALGNQVFGRIADKWSYKAATVIGSVLTVPAVLMALHAQTVQFFMLAQVLAGASYASIWVTHMNIIVAFAPPNERTHYIGLTAVISSIPMIIGSAVAGWVMDVWGFPVLSTAVIAINAAGTLLLWFGTRIPEISSQKEVPPTR
jgi:MFS family permease